MEPDWKDVAPGRVLVGHMEQTIEVVHRAPPRDVMTAELYVTLLARGRVSRDGLCVFGTEGRGEGVVTYRLTPRDTGTVLMERVA